MVGANDRSTCARCRTEFSTSYGQGVSGRRCPKTCRQRARCTIIWNCGSGTARWSASTTRSTWWCASRRDVKQVRRWRSSTRRPPRVLKKGVLARSFGLRRGQEDQRSQAAHPGRYAGSLVERRCSSGRRSGPRWSIPSFAPSAPTVPIHPAHAVSNKEPFDFYLSAFLNAGRTVDYLLGELAGIKRYLQHSSA